MRNTQFSLTLVSIGVGFDLNLFEFDKAKKNSIDKNVIFFEPKMSDADQCKGM